jgi:hypothetical protein
VFTGQLECDDDCIPRLLQALKIAGIDIHHSKPAFPKPFFLWRCREYASSELDSMEYTVSWQARFLAHATDDYMRDGEGIPHIKWPIKPPGRECGRIESAESNIMVVRGKVKRALENSGLKGLQLREAAVQPPSPLKETEKLWVVWSQLKMPPMKNFCCDNRGNKFRYQDRKAFPHGCLPFEGYFSPVELHYKREAVEAMGDFDIAVTQERFANVPVRMEPRVIISQQFRRFMEDELGLKMTGVPVRLDDDDNIPTGGPYPGPWEHLNQQAQSDE